MKNKKDIEAKDPQAKAQEIAESLRATAQQLGAEIAVIMVGVSDENRNYSYYALYQGSPFSVRGMLEIGAEALRAIIMPRK